MNLRKINATERNKVYLRFALILLFVGYIALALTPLVNTYIANAHKIPLSSRSCQEIYNLSIHGNLHPNNRTGFYPQDAVPVYYMVNCLNVTVQS